ncbi:MAG TPA: hypothetical protein VJH37_01960 [Candidatus Nanoarchaeia archaeon]|nr:hypothetical protein [Candidatus Nanoarchaeia archaeon]
MGIVERSKAQLSLMEKITLALAGPVLGMLPPRWQLQVTRNNNDAARIMSTSSRLANATYAIYAAGSLIGRVIGMDMDPTEGNMLTAIGVVIGVDTIVREGLYLGAYMASMHHNHPKPGMSYTEVWGEPIISITAAMCSKDK